MNDLDSVLDGSLRAAARLVAGGEISATQLVTASLERIAASPAGRSCFLNLRSEQALEAARRIDALEAAARRALPLCGVPWARKDLFSVPGEIASFGAHPHFGKQGGELAPALASLQAAGGIDMGGTHMSEFAMGPSGWSSIHRAIDNPLDGARVSGGSSSGSAAAVGGRFVHAALGTDTGGSARIPAAFCGVVALKPSPGRISTRGTLPVSATLDTVGPFARTVDDCALLFSALTSTAASRERDEPLRIAMLAADSLPVTPDAEMIRAMSQIGALLANDGHEVAEVAWSEFADTNILAGTVFLAEASETHLANLTEHADLIGPQVRERLLQGLLMPAPVYLAAMKARAERQQRFQNQVMADADVLILPVSPARAPLRSRYPALETTGDVLKLNGHAAAYTAAFNYLDLPVLSMPATPASKKSTLGLQIVARYGADEVALAAGVVIERLLG